jgi:hypothetical protein
MKSRRLTAALLTLLIAAPVAACGGSDDGEPALIAVFPDAGFAGRTTTLILVGEFTEFSEESEVDFGEGIAVESVIVLGGTGLMIEIRAAVDAALGARTVSVDGLDLPGGFSLASPVAVEILGTPAQGSLAILELTNLDLLNPFDLTRDEDGALLNLSVEFDGAGFAGLARVSSNVVEIQLGLDVHAAPGPLVVDLLSGPAGRALVSRASFDVAARTPTMITSSTVSGSLANGFDSALFEISASELTGFIVEPPDTIFGTARTFLLGPSGSFDDLAPDVAENFFGFIPIPLANVVPPGESVYLILWDGIDDEGFSYSFDVDLVEAPNTITHAEPNDTPGQAQEVAVPGGVLDATFSSAADEDWYAVNVGSEDIGKVITVVTGGYSLADPAIQIFAPDGETAMSDLIDGAFFDHAFSDPTTEQGLHFVRITSSDFGPTVPAQSDHFVVITLE